MGRKTDFPCQVCGQPINRRHKPDRPDLCFTHAMERSAMWIRLQRELAAALVPGARVASISGPEVAGQTQQEK